MSSLRNFTSNIRNDPMMQSLIPQKNKEKEKMKKYSCFYKMFYFLIPRVQTTPRKIFFGGEVEPPNYISNKVKNMKSNIFTFVPMVLWNQFKFFFNLFYLLLAISQLFDFFKVGLIFAYVAPLVFVIFLTMAKEAYDEVKRYFKDKQINSTIYKKLTREGLIDVQSCELKVGDIIEINANQRIPVDALLLYTNDPSSNIFLRTDQLDGETDWKLRRPIAFTQALLSQSHGRNPLPLLNLPGYLKVAAPNPYIYKFEGLFSVYSKPLSSFPPPPPPSSSSPPNSYSPPPLNSIASPSSPIPLASIPPQLQFEGNPVSSGLPPPSSSGKVKEGLGLENTLWTNTVLANGRIWAIVIYTGIESRFAMNSEKPRSKIGRLDLELNKISKILFAFMMVLSLVMTILGAKTNHTDRNILLFVKFVIIFSSIIPISMRVNLDFAKIIYCFLMTRDQLIPNTIPRNSAIPEELGRIQFLLTDKTGTLTQNEMHFKRLSLENKRYMVEDMETIRKTLKKHYKSLSPLDKSFESSSSMHDLRHLTDHSIEEEKTNSTPKAKKSKKNCLLPSLVEALSVCHNVTPVKDDEEEQVKREEEGERKGMNREVKERKSKEKGKKRKEEGKGKKEEGRGKKGKGKEEEGFSINDGMTPFFLEEGGKEGGKKKEKNYQSSSPDEIALVKIAGDFGIELLERDQKTMKILLPGSGSVREYEILANFPFSSESKRMGIVLRNRETLEILFYLKGADSVMKSFVHSSVHGFLQEECENLAREGLRTLVFSYKKLEEEEWRAWKHEYDQSSLAMENREEKIRFVLQKLEKNLTLLGITGVEDKLQEGVCSTLENLRAAGLHIWMLTGDKMETAQCIGISAGIKHPSQELFFIKEVEREEDIEEILNELEKSEIHKIVIVIDGTSVRSATEKGGERFFKVMEKAPAVICCRCSPTQKSLITESIGKFCKKQTAAVGDGGNDVGMIQKANVGIGIVGKEGMQAALASDFSIEKFRYLNNLLLWHGRLSYKRSASLSQFIIHRGLIISFIQAAFVPIFYFLPISIFGGALQLGYSTFFTFLPVFCLILDNDVDVTTALRYPPLYETMQKGRELNFKTALIWIWISIFQGTLIVVLSITVFSKGFLDIITISFTTLILTEFLNLYSSLNRIHILMILSQIVSASMYFACITIFHNLFGVSPFVWSTFLKICLTTLLVWVPPHVVKLLKKYYDPNDYEKIMQNNLKTREIQTKLI